MTCRHFVAVVATVLSLCVIIPNQSKAQALIVNGEEIADAKLFAAARAEKMLYMYGAYPSESIGPVLEEFKKDSGIDYEYIRLPTQKMYDRVIAEFAAGKFEADYADLTDLSYMKDWLERGILASHRVPNFDKIATSLKEPQGRWYYIVRIPYGIGINTEVLPNKSDYPTSWRGLFDEKWRGHLGFTNMDGGGSALTMWSFLRLRVADDAWARIAALRPRYYAASAPLDSDFERGRVGIGVITASAVASQLARGAPVTLVFPDEGIPAFGAYGNVTSVAKHPNAAKVWMNYITSKRGGDEVAKTGVYGTHPDSNPPDVKGLHFPPSSKVWNIPAEQWDQIRAEWPEQWKQISVK